MAIQWEVLSGLRFFLALVVVCHHLQHFVPKNDAFVLLQEFSGFSAVLGFLLISGFSIAHSITRNSKGFYQRRIIRIYPLYFCSLIVSVVPFMLHDDNFLSFDGTEYVMPRLLNFFGNMFFAQNIFLAPLPSNGVVWSLGVELICYLLAPLLLKLSLNRTLLIVGFSAGSFLLYELMGHPLGKDIAFLRYGLPLLFLLWAWLLGFLLFLYPNKNWLKSLTVSLGCLVLSATAYGEARLYILTYVLVALVLSNPLSFQMPKFVSKFLSYLGELSYPLYLFHSFAFTLGYFILSFKNSFSLIFLSMLISIIFYHLVDVPIRYRLRTKVKPLS
jgi:peptidoglycan/LPS O-acetylase OafA/YrhL